RRRHTISYGDWSSDVCSSDLPLTGHDETVTTAVFSPDGHTLATGSSDHTVRLWNVADLANPAPLGQPLTVPTGTGHALAFSPDEIGRASCRERGSVGARRGWS